MLYRQNSLHKYLRILCHRSFSICAGKTVITEYNYSHVLEVFNINVFTQQEEHLLILQFLRIEPPPYHIKLLNIHHIGFFALMCNKIEVIFETDTGYRY